MKINALLIGAILYIVCCFQLTYASSPKELYQQGNKLAEQNNHQEAIKIYKEALKCKIENIHHKALLYYQMGLSYSQLGDLKNSISSYTTCIKLEPKDSFAYYSRALEYVKLEKFDKAKSDLNYSIHLNPKYIEAYKIRAMVFAQLNKFKLALIDIEKVIGLKTKDVFFYNLAAWIYATYPDASIRNADRAVILAKQSVALFEDSISLDVLAAAYAEQGSFDLALQTQELAMKKLPDDLNKKIRGKLEQHYQNYKDGKPWRDKNL